MSIISSRHQITRFIAGTTAGSSKPMNEQRLAKIGYKSSKNQPARFQSVCASVPQIASSEIFGSMNELIPYVRTLLESAQDGIIRSLYESSVGTLDGINDEEISIDACIAYLECEQNGGRLTKELLENWFVHNVQDNLSIVIAEKLHTEDLDDPRVAQNVNVYKGLISSLAGAKTIFSDVQIKSAQKALELSSSEDEISKKLTVRLESMSKKGKIEDLLEL